jgi:hypothetical protein
MIQVKLLWFDQRDGNGIVVDEFHNEYYIDISVLKFKPCALSKNGISRTGLTLTIELNTSIKDCLCGMNVELFE